MRVIRKAIDHRRKGVLVACGEWALLLLALGSCTPSPWRLSYLRQAVNHATQDEVAQTLGAPARTQELTTGGTVWTYQYRGKGQGAKACVEYIVTFDEEKILREATRQDCHKP
jgi:hypothetical protein